MMAEKFYKWGIIYIITMFVQGVLLFTKFGVGFEQTEINILLWQIICVLIANGLSNNKNC